LPVVAGWIEQVSYVWLLAAAPAARKLAVAAEPEPAMKVTPYTYTEPKIDKLELPVVVTVAAVLTDVGGATASFAQIMLQRDA